MNKTAQVDRSAMPWKVVTRTIQALRPTEAGELCLKQSARHVAVYARDRFEVREVRMLPVGAMKLPLVCATTLLSPAEIQLARVPHALRRALDEIGQYPKLSLIHI